MKRFMLSKPLNLCAVDYHAAHTVWWLNGPPFIVKICEQTGLAREPVNVWLPSGRLIELRKK